MSYRKPHRGAQGAHRISLVRPVQGAWVWLVWGLAAVWFAVLIWSLSVV